MISKFWNFLTLLGCRKSYSLSKQKKIKLVNQLNMMASFIYLLIGAVYFAFGDLSTALFVESLILLNAGAFYLQFKGYHDISVSFFLISSYLSIFYFDSYAGLNAGAALYFIPTLISLFFLFDFQKERELLFVHILIIFTLLLVNFITDHTFFKSESVSELMRSRLFFANTLFTLLSSLYFVVVKFKANRSLR